MKNLEKFGKYIVIVIIGFLVFTETLLVLSHESVCKQLEAAQKEITDLHTQEKMMSELASRSVRPEYGMTGLSLDAVRAWSASLSGSKELSNIVALPERTYNGHAAFYPIGRDISGTHGEHYRVVNALRVFTRYGKTHYEPALIVYMGTMEGGLTRIDMKTGESSVYYQGDWKPAKFSNEFAQNVIRNIACYFQDSPSSIPRDL